MQIKSCISKFSPAVSIYCCSKLLRLDVKTEEFFCGIQTRRTQSAQNGIIEFELCDRPTVRWAYSVCYKQKKLNRRRVHADGKAGLWGKKWRIGFLASGFCAVLVRIISHCEWKIWFQVFSLSLAFSAHFHCVLSSIAIRFLITWWRLWVNLIYYVTCWLFGICIFLSRHLPFYMTIPSVPSRQRVAWQILSRAYIGLIADFQ